MKLLRTITLVVFCGGLFWQPAAEATSGLSVGNAQSFPGVPVNVPIILSLATNVVGAQIDVAFNSNKVMLTEPIVNSRITNLVMRSRLMTNGLRRVLFYSANNTTLPSTNALLGNLSCTIAPGEYVSSGPMTPGNVILAGANATAFGPVNVASGSVTVTPIFRLPDGQVKFFFSAVPNKQYVVQATTNFVKWVNIATNTATGNYLDLVDTDAAQYPLRFYRWADAAALGQLSSPLLVTNGQMQIQVTGAPGRNYTLQQSTNLVTWQDLQTLTVIGTTASFTNTVDPSAPARFFRLKSFLP